MQIATYGKPLARWVVKPLVAAPNSLGVAQGWANPGPSARTCGYTHHVGATVVLSPLHESGIGAAVQLPHQQDNQFQDIFN